MCVSAGWILFILWNPWVGWPFSPGILKKKKKKAKDNEIPQKVVPPQMSPYLYFTLRAGRRPAKTVMGNCTPGYI